MSEGTLLRFMTAGSVDDGKSTLIGRLLYDSKAIFDDQLETLSADEDWEARLANLLDGLKAEREQGITIDVAYRYFATPTRKFIIADSPGHVQYTRNMVTAASTASLAVILVDARKGIIEQTRRHAYISSLLRIPHFAVCVNKMDLVDYDQEVFFRIRDEFNEFASKNWSSKIEFIPMSALKGDNVVTRSEKMAWYSGPTLIEHLDSVEVSDDRNLTDGRFPVQYVIRPRDDENHDFRGYAGRIVSGEFKVGQKVTVLPSRRESTVKSISVPLDSAERAYAPMAITMCLEDEIDISRGDVIVPSDKPPQVSDKLQAQVCWMSDDPLWPNRKYQIKIGTCTVKAIVRSINSKLDIATFEDDTSSAELKLNDIGSVEFQLAKPVPIDSYQDNKGIGGFIIVDEVSNSTVGAGLVVSANEGARRLPDYNI
jgi:sulfate adenylyltransferase large subunit